METKMPQVNLTAKEIHIIVQAIRIAMESDQDHISNYCKTGELNQLRNKLQNVKDV
jgi:hypothetical protein